MQYDFPHKLMLPSSNFNEMGDYDTFDGSPFISENYLELAELKEMAKAKRNKKKAF